MSWGRYGQMKWRPRLRVYNAANVEWNPSTETGTSYNWWVFVKRINGKLVFNDHNYSVTTNRHQSKMRSLLERLNVQIDAYVNTRESLDSERWVTSSIETAQEKIEEIERVLASPRRKRSLDSWRYDQLEEYRNQILNILALTAIT